MFGWSLGVDDRDDWVLPPRSYPCTCATDREVTVVSSARTTHHKATFRLLEVGESWDTVSIWLESQLFFTTVGYYFDRSFGVALPTFNFKINCIIPAQKLRLTQIFFIRLALILSTSRKTFSKSVKTTNILLLDFSISKSKTFLLS